MNNAFNNIFYKNHIFVKKDKIKLNFVKNMKLIKINVKNVNKIIILILKKINV